MFSCKILPTSRFSDSVSPYSSNTAPHTISQKLLLMLEVNITDNCTPNTFSPSFLTFTNAHFVLAHFKSFLTLWLQKYLPHTGVLKMNFEKHKFQSKHRVIEEFECKHKYYHIIQNAFNICHGTRGVWGRGWERVCVIGW